MDRPILRDLMITDTRNILKDKHVVIIWQRFLPYHIARIKKLNERLAGMGCRLTAIEAAPLDNSYGFTDEISLRTGFNHLSLFPAKNYHQLQAGMVYEKILETLERLDPDIVFAPAINTPEGMAAVSYRVKKNKRSVMMDDAWELTYKRGRLINFIKRLIHLNIDAAFVPAPSHLSHYKKLGFPEGRIVFGIDTVDNDYFSSGSAGAGANESQLRQRLTLPRKYFLYVGRFLPKKGLETLIEAYKIYRRETAKDPWSLVLVGSGSHIDQVRESGQNVPGVVFKGPAYGSDLCSLYGLASVAVFPSLKDTWGLVINEAMASGLPVIVSTGYGAARSLVSEGENGWSFEPGDVKHLAVLMATSSKLPESELQKMGEASRRIIQDWSLDTFVEGAISAMALPRRREAGLLSNMAVKFWKGHMRTT